MFRWCSGVPVALHRDMCASHVRTPSLMRASWAPSSTDAVTLTDSFSGQIRSSFGIHIDECRRPRETTPIAFFEQTPVPDRVRNPRFFSRADWRPNVDASRTNVNSEPTRPTDQRGHTGARGAEVIEILADALFHHFLAELARAAVAARRDPLVDRQCDLGAPDGLALFTKERVHVPR